MLPVQPKALPAGILQYLLKKQCTVLYIKTDGINASKIHEAM